VLKTIVSLEERELVDALEEAIHHGILTDGGDRFQFVHSLIRHTCTQGPSLLRRRLIHRDIAQTLEVIHATHLDLHTMEIAYHLIRAGSTVEVSRVVAYARQAGHQAFRLFSWNDAAKFYEAALAVAETHDDFSVQEVADLAYWAGLSYQRDQDVSKCLENYEKAIVGYRAVGDLHGLARAEMGKVHIYYTLAAVSYGSLIDMQPLEELLEQLKSDDAKLRGEIVSIMAGAYWTAKQPQKAREMSQYALEIGQSLADDALCSSASFMLGLAQSQESQLQDSLNSWRNSLAYAQRANDRWLQGYPWPRIPAMLLMLGEVEEAERVARDAAALTRENQDWGYLSIALSHLASVAAIRGQIDETNRHVNETMRMVHRSGYHWGGFRALLVQAYAYMVRGEWEPAERALNTLIEPGRVFHEIGPVIQSFVGGVRQLVRAYVDPPGEVAVPQVVEDLGDANPEPYDFPLLCAMVELADLLEQPSLIDIPYRALTIAWGQGMVFVNGWVVLVPRVLGVASSLKGKWQEAEPYFQQAIRLATASQAPPELARSYLDYARMLVAKGEVQDQPQALAWVDRALPILQLYEMKPFIEQAIALQARLSVAQRHAEALAVTSLPRRTPAEEQALRLAMQRTQFLR
jgi:tetratricopeptide (TPR) repeat protein